MPSYTAAVTRNAALVLFLLLIGSAPLMRAQQGEIFHEAEVGIIVTGTSDDAAEILKQLKAGMDFGVLAKEKSTDPTSVDGGYMGRLSPEQLRPEFRDALKGIKPGQFTDVVHVPFGFAILAVLANAPNTRDLDAKQLFTIPVHYSIGVSGLDEADAAFQQYPKPEGWNRDFHQMCTIKQESHPAAVESIERLIHDAELQPSGQVDPLDMMRAHIALAQLHGYSGEMDKSITEWNLAYQIAQSGVPDAVPYLQESLGVTYLHLSEMENGAYHAARDMDIFPPLKPTAYYEKQEDSKLAIQYLTKYLEQRPDEFEAKWLLNLAYMTLGGYPSEVPSKYLIPLSTFESKENIGHFTDVAPTAGLNGFTGAGGAIVDDFDNDGQLDIVTSSMNLCEPLHYYHNNGDGSFTDRTAQAGLSNQLGGLNLVAADYNNDGCLDLLVLRGGWEFPMRRSLLRNNCDGTFTDVTQESGLGDIVTESQTAAWVDIDNDGYLDLFVANENGPSQLFRNRGNGTFEDISHSAGIDKTAYSKGVVAADYDNDGYVDFYVSNANGANFLYHNNHDRTFTEVGRQAGVQAPYFSFATWFFDYDNDGWPDLFVTSYFSSIDQVIRSYLGLPVSIETLKLYRNMHNGTFQDVTKEVGLDKVFMPMGANFGDVDNDGFLDIYLGVGQPSFAALMPHVLLRNKEGKSFVDITASSGTGELHKGHGIAFADLERNGHEDIVAEIGGAVPSDKHTLRLFRNPGNDNDWINIRLMGVKSNRSAVGAQIKLTVENDAQTARTIYRTVGDTSSFGGNPLEQHIGLGHSARIVALDVWWPATNTRQHFSHVDKNQFIAIKEFANEYTKLTRETYRLGGDKTTVASK